MSSKLVTIRFQKFKKNKEGLMEVVGQETASYEYVAETENLMELRTRNGSQIIVSKKLVISIEEQTTISSFQWKKP